MSVEDDLRLAWQADRDGRSGRRDVLLTLALAENGPDDAAWVRRAWVHLVTRRPDHLFAGFTSLDEALADPHVTARLARLRLTFPPTRVRWLLERADASRGPYTGRKPSLSILLDDLLGSRAVANRKAVHTDSDSGESGPHALPVPAARAFDIPTNTDPLLVFYLSVLMAIATLLACTLQSSERGSKAA